MHTENTPVTREGVDDKIQAHLSTARTLLALLEAHAEGGIDLQGKNANDPNSAEQQGYALRRSLANELDGLGREWQGFAALLEQSSRPKVSP